MTFHASATPQPAPRRALHPRRVTIALAGAALLALVTPCQTLLHAQTTQVGSAPSTSPYRDLQTPQRLTVFGGYFIASQDAVKATPGSAPLFGLRYEVTVGGPAQFVARLARAGTQRTAYDPTQSANSRTLGTVNIPMYIADVGFSFNLTGQKTWHSLVPIAGFGLGVASATKKTDNDPYSFGTQFEISTELGLRYIPNNSLEGRVTLGNMFYQTRYPNQYFTKATDGTAVLGDGVSKSSFRANWVLTAGISFPIFR